ncbi:hypothetical protein IW261DRAFT_1425091 [Armillaria novae-zelandiae]|uniref:Uncharacterized protein n=1 Tax=Armillaria novae-zelandiae TaxID=153914 RepID=A0AA39NT89_9AGAR|nr:hypothetical protein IW261DRAFT_1425091 [Armillaria novae-zelandiae]
MREEYELANDLRDKLANFRKHQNRTQQRVNAFNAILAPMMDAYLDWFMEHDEDRGVHLPPGAPSSDSWVWDNTAYLPLICLLRPLFAIVSFPVPPSDQGVKHRIMKNLSREDVDWHLKNCCSACMFELEGEAQMEFSMFGAMDSNDSLKRVPHSKLVESLDGGRVSIEREDTQDGGRSYVLYRSMVDLWSKDAIGDVNAPLPDEITPCKERWKNMSDDHTSKMWNIFDEMGFFLSLCRHGSVLLGTDMAKYPLSVVSKLLETFGERLGLGYDIGCLEDLETLECFFSKSNTLAGVIQYASWFHRHQRITWYLKHIDHFESFEHLKIIEMYPALQKSMRELGVEDEKEFDSWLKEEEGQGSSKSKGLVRYYNTPGQLLEKWLQELEHLQDLEQSLNISPDECWTIGVIGHQSDLRAHENEHVAYRPPLQWERVVEYAFLSDFDLLHDVRRDMSVHKWATPAGHKAMDTYFKICRVKEEIKCLNIEIQHVITYMHIEDAYLQRCEKSIAITSPALALQVSHYQHGHERFYAMHMRRFYTLSKDPHFTGDISVGSVAGVQEGFELDTPEDVSMDAEDSPDNATMATDSIDHNILDLSNDSQSNGSDDEDEGNTIDEEVEAIMLISGDNAWE